MKFINYLQTIAGIEIYPLISLIIFFGFFTLLVVYAMKSKKEHLDELKNIPLNNEPGNN